jgi:hypothetical protein
MIELIPEERIESRIFIIRGHKVMIDRDLAGLYGVKTFNLNKAVKRNIQRFPSDFMFQLTEEEYQALRFQFGILEKGRHSKYLPYAFTEQGIAMLSSVLRSERAILVNIAIMRAFVKLKQVLSTHKEVSRKLKELEQRVEGHDSEIKAIFDAIRKLVEPDKKSSGKIGFVGDREEGIGNGGEGKGKRGEGIGNGGEGKGKRGEGIGNGGEGNGKREKGIGEWDEG